MAANNIKGSKDIKFSVVRYGNVFGSRGSVVPFFLERKSSGVLPITHKEMTRFSITLRESVDLVIKSLLDSIGGEIIVPKIPSYRILDLAQAIAPSAELVYTGIRPGEKLHEEMITSSDSFNTYISKDKYIILNNGTKPPIGAYEKVSEGFSYNSQNNENFLSINVLKELINSLNLKRN